MYKYETHLHTYPVSKCGRAGVEESLEFYKTLGFAGVFITNHFLDGNINCDKNLPYAEQIEFYFSDYERAVPIGEEMGMKVFCGVELSYHGTDFLIYGLDKQWYLDHPEIMDMTKKEELSFMMEAGALVIQAHPFREASFIDHVRLFPNNVHGVEVINAAQGGRYNKMAELYAAHYGLLEFAGSDNHTASRRQRVAGILCKEPVVDEKDFVSKVLKGETETFVEPNPLYVPEPPKE